MRVQLQTIEATMIPGEEVEAVFDMKGGSAGFIAITTKRVIIYDKASSRDTKALVSIPYSCITSISAQDKSELLGDRVFKKSRNLTLKAGVQDLEFELRDADEARLAHHLILTHIL